jgi:hypothetical protein
LSGARYAEVSHVRRIEAAAEKRESPRAARRNIHKSMLARGKL